MKTKCRIKTAVVAGAASLCSMMLADKVYADILLFRDNGENVTAGSAPDPDPGEYNITTSSYPQKVVAASVGFSNDGVTPTPAASPGGGTQFMLVDRDGADIGRRNYGEFVTPATGAGIVRMELDLYVHDGQIQIGLGSDQAGVAIDGTQITLGAGFSNGGIFSFGDNVAQHEGAFTFESGKWEHVTIEYTLGEDVFTITINHSVSKEIDLAFDSVTEINRLWVIAGSGSTTGWYDNAEAYFVPEPASAGMIGMGLIFVLSGRRRRVVA